MKAYASWSSENISDFVTRYNKLRLQNKDKWISFSGTVNGITVEVKSFNTWTQIFRCEKFADSGIADSKVSDWKKELESWLNSAGS